ncbi:TetR/AcrR family transcriptional regulator [Thalassotalea psychrophila]|uniref:TetR/AcrR family transcriptional regulator n=1 Tax=Thalassotalea psychrophila TaxID=3065647 RepID=A0ABY9TQP7_9GAMM|nr:TetR/AcrR family transcriptional regulator [Colwelliaceae bacterium SQ149]
MKKPKTRSKSEEKRQLILAAATSSFCDKGFSLTSMDSIANSAGVSKQTVYSHFGNKDDLFAASILNKCEKFRTSALPESSLCDPKLALKTFAMGFIQLLLSEEGMAIHRVCIAESQTNPQVSQLFYAAGPEPVVAEISKLLESYSSEGLIVVENYHFSALQFLSLMKGEAVMRREYNTEKQIGIEEISDYIDSSVDLFLRGCQYKAMV